MLESAAVAQKYIVQTQTFELEDGLQHRQVLSINRDNNGVLWFGTKAGLQRYDGHDFKSWSKQNSRGLIENVTAIGFDDQDYLWAWNTTKNAFCFVDLKSESILSYEERFGSNFPIKGLEQKGRWVHQSEQLNIDKDGKLWFVLSNPPALVSFSKGIFQEKPLTDVMGNGATLDFLDSEGNIWVESTHNDILTVYKVDTSGHLKKKWDFEKAVKAHRFSEKNQHVHFQVGFQEVEILYEQVAGQVTEVNRAPANTHWWVSGGELSWEYRLGQWQQEDELSELDLSQASLNEEIFTTYPTTVFRDNDNKIWVGNAWGLGLISWKITPFQTYFSFGLKEEKKYNNSTRGLLVFKEDIIQSFDFSKLKSRKGTRIQEVNEANHLSCLLKNDEKSFWAAASDYSNKNIILIQYELRGEAWIVKSKHFISTYKEHPWTLAKGDRREILIGTNKGLWVYDTRRKSAYFTTDFLQMLSPLTVYDIVEVRKNEYYLLCSQGLLHINIRDKKLINHYSSLSSPNPLPFDEVYHMYKQSEDSLWLATNEGLLLWNPSSNNHTLYHDLFALEYGSVYAVYPGTKNDLWISSDYGLIRFDKDSKLSQVYLEQDGICHKEFNRTSHARGPDGTLYFGGLNGLTGFHPNDFSIKTEDNLRKLFISSFKIHSEKQETNATAFARSDELITVPPNIQYISIRFSLPNYTGGHMNAYRWNLNGNWNRQESNVLYLSNLPYGEHNLKLEGVSSDGSLNRTYKEIQIFKEKPFYLKTWFFLSLFLIGTITLVILFRLRTQQLLRNKIKLEAEVKQATEKIRKDKQVIEQQAEDLKEMDKIKTRFFNNVSHELRTPLSLILGPLQKAQNDSSSSSQLLDISIRNTRKLKKRIDELLDLAKTDAGKIKIQPHPISYQEFLKTCIDNFKSLAEEKKTTLVLNGNFEKGRVSTDPNLHEKIMDNLLSNALKHSPENGQIEVRFNPQLADAVSTTEKTLTRKLKSFSGLSAGAYIKEIRMQHAYQLLENGIEDSIQQLAYKCGYKRSDSFTSAFEKRFGRKPSSYLENHNLGENE